MLTVYWVGGWSLCFLNTKWERNLTFVGRIQEGWGWEKTRRMKRRTSNLGEAGALCGVHWSCTCVWVRVRARTHNWEKEKKKPWRKGSGRTIGQPRYRGNLTKNELLLPGICGLFSNETGQIEPWLLAGQRKGSIKRRGSCWLQRSVEVQAKRCPQWGKLTRRVRSDEVWISLDGSALLCRIFGNV